ncbi:MAG: hypothetical protein KBF88_13350 [Polyangiaceae bacterium]|nr:hypothetical protein [Polyangiaceae bacterium]
MTSLWLTVEDTFVAQGRGVIVEPKFVPTNPPKGKFMVLVKLPSGEEKRLEATLDIAHSRGGLPPFAMLRLHGVSPSEIPKGSQVWFEDGGG